MRSIFFILIISLFFFSCHTNSKRGWDPEAYFESTYKIIQDKSIKSNEINWDELKEKIKDSIQFNSNEDVFTAIAYTIKLIDDGHSVFYDGSRPNNFTIKDRPIPKVEARIIENNIAYLKLPGFVANDSLTKIYSENIREKVLELDETRNLSGWIIDLRINKGGKLSRESLGISPLFENPLIGISVNSKGNFRYTTCDSNYFHFGNVKMDSLTADFDLNNKNKKIAVLIGKNTASGGEFLALAFKFQNNTKVFGQKTRGKTSHLQLYTFDNSEAQLFLAFERSCDRNKNIIKENILPDIECEDEICLNRAIEWIKEKSQSDIPKTHQALFLP